MRARDVAGAARRWVLMGWWWVLDYLFVLGWQVRALRRGADPAHYLRGEGARAPDVVLLPGVYEPWRFLLPVAERLRVRGHAVHLLPELAWNSAPVPAAADAVLGLLRDRDLRDVVLLAHSKGGLIGKHLMGRDEGRVRAMVAVNTPFGGSVYARWFPVDALRAFRPDDPTVMSLARDVAPNARVVSAYSCFDPHVPQGSHLPGARNVVLRTPGHFRALADPDLVGVVVSVLDDGP
ncbi:lipase family protein [Cellulomonas bogoriensis]|uniref:hypothetical protein n=1 Tax=Cellulomonas bogoriensis TaxID=301388 RepID=UPI000B043C3E|nr:hypothetical protein [Cellulomonas bogoriensis]